SAALLQIPQAGIHMPLPKLTRHRPALRIQHQERRSQSIHIQNVIARFPAPHSGTQGPESAGGIKAVQQSLSSLIDMGFGLSIPMPDAAQAGAIPEHKAAIDTGLFQPDLQLLAPVQRLLPSLLLTTDQGTSPPQARPEAPQPGAASRQGPLLGRGLSEQGKLLPTLLGNLVHIRKNGLYAG